VVPGHCPPEACQDGSHRHAPHAPCESTPSWVVTLVEAIIVEAIGEEVVACEQELQHGLWVTKSREVQARAQTIFLLGIKAPRVEGEISIHASEGACVEACLKGDGVEDRWFYPSK
jgi:hypothetical protein